MTNEEKAKEKARQVFPCPNEDEQRRIVELAYNDACQWKDNQFKEYLEKVRQDYAHELCVNRDWKQGAMEARIKHEVIVKIINELFKED